MKRRRRRPRAAWSRPAPRTNPMPAARTPALRFSPTAWAKLLWFCRRGPTEIGGFGRSAVDDPLFITDFAVLRQQASVVTVRFDDTAVAEYFEDQVAAGRKPADFARIWCHTHPGDCPRPSSVDEATFARVFSPCDWSVMFILTRTGATYARLQLQRPIPLQLPLEVTVDYRRPFAATDEPAWEEEYGALIDVFEFAHRTNGRPAALDWPCDPDLPPAEDLTESEDE